MTVIAEDWRETQLNLDIDDGVNGDPVRFDRGYIRKPELTPEGFFRGEATYCRDGVLVYRSPNGTERRELRLPEENKRALADFGFKPVTVEHPPMLLNAGNAKNFAIGQTDSTTFYDPRSGFVRGVISVFDSEAIADIKGGKRQEISIGYQCSIDPTPGEWKGQRYDAIQRNLKINHVALTQKGRAGADVRVLLDSEDVAYQVDSPVSDTQTSTKKRTMDLVRNGLTFKDLPAEVVTFLHQEFQKLDSEVDSYKQQYADLKTTTKNDSATLEELSSELESVRDDHDRQLGRADELDSLLEKADSALKGLGYRRDSSGEYVCDGAEMTKEVIKKKNKWTPPMDEDMEDEDMEDPEEEADETPDEEAAEEETEKTTIKKRKKTKADSVSAVLKTWKEADKVIPGISDSDRFDSELNVAGIRRLVVAQLRPNRKLEGRSDSYIEAIYEELMESNPPQQRVDYTDSLDTFVSLASQAGTQPNSLNQRDKALSEAWQQPMAMSRSN